MANALGGGRYGVETALSGQLGEETLDKIRKKGLQEAWTSGLDIFQKDRDAASSGARDRSRLASDKLSQGLKGLGALQTTGETQRALDQQKRDLSYEEFVRQQQFPKQNLQELSGILRGFQVPPTTYQTSQTYKPPMSLGQQLMAAGTLGAGISKGLGKSLLGTKHGGSVNAAGGGLLSVIPERYKKGDNVEEKTTYDSILEFFNLEIEKDDKGNTYVKSAGDPPKVDVRKQLLKRLVPNIRLNTEETEETSEVVSPPPLHPFVPRSVVSSSEKETSLPIPEGADDELTQEEFLEQITSTPSPIDSDSGWDIEKMMAGFGEGFDEAAPYLASYAKQKGWDDSAEGLKGISEAA